MLLFAVSVRILKDLDPLRIKHNHKSSYLEQQLMNKASIFRDLREGYQLRISRRSEDYF